MFKLVKKDIANDQTLPIDDENNGQQRKSQISAGKRTFLTLQVFVFVSGVLMCSQNALSIYTKSVLTSIERRFQISSSLAGLIVGSFNFGNMLFVVLVSKLSSNGHRPRIMAGGSMVIALGGFVNVIPHIVSPDYDPTLISDKEMLFNSTILLDSTETSVAPSCSSSNIYVLLVLGEMLQGIGATVLVPLGSSFIDDFAKSGKSPLYLGIMFLLQNLGPGVGYLVGSLTTMLYVDFDRVDTSEIKITMNDGSWVGAWWLGYIIIGLCVILTAIPLFWFPRKMEKSDIVGKKSIREIKNGNNKMDFGIDEDDVIPLDGTLLRKHSNVKKTSECLFAEKRALTRTEKVMEIFSDLYTTVKRLMTNPVYLLVVMGYAGLMFVVGALTAFMPKFLEIVFYQSKSQASMIFGLSMPLVICIGLFSGGFIVQRSKLGAKGTLRFIVCAAGATIFLIIPTYYINCDPQESLHCSNISVSDQINLTHCKDERGEICRPKCYAFVGMMCLAALLCCHIVTPSYSVILRTVKPKDKCTAIGLKFLIIRLLAFIPSPMITGAVIDDTCTQWSAPPGCIGTATCLEHDRESFRFSYLHIIVLGVTATCIFNTAGCIVQHRTQTRTSKPVQNEDNV
uniref:solute carrier organic anion transporter family member 1A5-like n=1 Tax=Styela clava TaxID=7725 RepID=UPI0019399201|nr:solute carrier organic anion transporter family member 1A5-like [Styela clava]